MFPACRLASGENSTLREVGKGKSRRNMREPYAPRGMVDHHGPNPYKPLYNRVYGRLDALAAECRIPPEPEFLEPGSVTIDKRRDKVQDAIGGMRVSWS